MVLSEAHFVDVPLHMFDAVTMMSSDILAFDQTPEVLDVIRVYPVSSAELTYRVFDRQMDESVLRTPVENVVAGEVITDHNGVVFTYLVENGKELPPGEFLPLRVGESYSCVDFLGVPLLDTYHGSLLCSSTSLCLGFL